VTSPAALLTTILNNRPDLTHMDQNNNKKTILVAVTDIFFYTKIRDALLPQGYLLERARTQEDFSEKLGNLTPSAVILNMNDEKVDGFDALRRVHETQAAASIPTLAYANHEEVVTWRKAKELGVTKIVSRNEFSARTRGLVEELLAISDQPATSADKTLPD
jgi:PleD family two-component response regulator